MKKPIYITTIKLDPKWESEIIATARPFTKEETKTIKQNIKFYKAEQGGWKNRSADLLDYAVLTPFKDIVLTIYQTEIE